MKEEQKAKLFRWLTQPRTVRETSEHLNIGEKAVYKKLHELEDQGYRLYRQRRRERWTYCLCSPDHLRLGIEEVLGGLGEYIEKYNDAPSLDAFCQILSSRYRAGYAAIDHAILQALRAGVIDLRSVRLTAGEDTDTYMVFVRG